MKLTKTQADLLKQLIESLEKGQKPDVTDGIIYMHRNTSKKLKALDGLVQAGAVRLEFVDFHTSSIIVTGAGKSALENNQNQNQQENTMSALNTTATTQAVNIPSVSYMIQLESIIEQINNSSVHSPDSEEFKDQEGIDWPDDTVEIATLNHLWHGRFIIATMVYQIGDRFLGVQGPIEVLSESMELSDYGEPVEAFEVEAVPSVTYKAMPTTEATLKEE